MSPWSLVGQDQAQRERRSSSSVTLSVVPVVAVCRKSATGNNSSYDGKYAASNDTSELFPVPLMLRRVNGWDELRGVGPFFGSTNGIAGLSRFYVLF